jgi:starch synthase
MKIAFLASEAVPFVKSGGLADVIGALSKTLAARGHDVTVVLPRYAAIDKSWNLKPFLNPVGVWMGNKEEWCSSFTSTVDGVRFCFVEFNNYFDRQASLSRC